LIFSGGITVSFSRIHAEREKIILPILAGKEFVSFREIEESLDGSPATIRRDLERLDSEEKIHACGVGEGQS
tara:strand:+ start:13925 stop:14140 length:216 start_codon:yes stop_codon:yes gene_type:complete